MGIKNDDTHWMNQAYQLALKAEAIGEVPVGAVLINAENELIGAGFNAMIQKHDPTAHAEIQAIRFAGHAQQNYRLANTTLYVTLEPCVMCAGAIFHARIHRLVFASRDFKCGAAGSVCNVFHESLSHIIQIDEGVLQSQCTELLVNFFKKRRC